jgi:hypothetical protein
MVIFTDGKIAENGAGGNRGCEVSAKGGSGRPGLACNRRSFHGRGHKAFAVCRFLKILTGLRFAASEAALFLGGLSAIEQAFAQLRELHRQIFRLLTGQRRSVDFYSQLFADGLVGAARQAKPAGAPGKLKQLAPAATNAAPPIRRSFTALETA